MLDNWEHILAAAETVLDQLLHNTPVHILATSRVRFMIEGEVAMPLAGPGSLIEGRFVLRKFVYLPVVASP